MKEKNKQALLFPFLDVLLNGFNFILIIFYSWHLDKNDFGIFNALMALLAILFIVGTSLQTYIAKEEAKKRSTSNQSISKKKILWITIFLNLILLINVQWIAQMLRSDIPTLLFLQMIFNLHIFLSYSRGLMQGNKEFLKLNISFYIEVGGKLIFTLILLPITKSSLMALTCLALGMLLSSIYGATFILTKSKAEPTELSVDSKHNHQGLVPVVLGNLFLFYMTGINVMVVNREMPDESHIYAMSTKFSLLIIAVIFSVITVLIPYLSEKVDDQEEFRRFVRQWLIRLVAIGGIIVIGYALFIGEMSKRLLTDEYQGLKQLVMMQSGAYVLLGITQWLVAVSVVKEEMGYLKYLLINGVTYSILLLTIADTIQSVIMIEYLVHGSLCALLLIRHFIRSDRYEEESYAIFIMERH